MTIHQVSFFDNEKKQHSPFLHVVKDGEVVDMEVEDIFDSSLYKTLKAITFVSSPKFFFDLAEKFEEVSLILGIGDGNVVEQFNDGLLKFLDLESRNEFFENLSDHAKNKIFDDIYKIRYSMDGYPIHSKIFLLEGESDTRLIIGSANLTSVAFSNSKQFEEVLIFDNSKMYEIYNKRFKDIYDQTVDFVPEKYKISREIITDAESLIEVLKDEITKLTINTIVSDEEMEEIKDLERKKKEETEKLIKQKKIVNLVMRKSKKDGGYVFRRPVEIDKKRPALRSLYVKQVLSRIYYIRFDHSFNEKYKAESNEVKNNIFRRTNNVLFKDFTFRLSQRIQNEEVYYKRSDPLYVARELFKDYFDELGIPIPKWFPVNMLNDYREIGAINWKRIYENHREAFTDVGNNTLSVRFDLINESFISQRSKDRQFLLNLLPNGTIKNNGTIVDLHKSVFLDFINKKDYEKKGMWIKRILKL